MTRQPNVTDEELDLLAEGELSKEQRTDLFRRLDEEPSQWKTCALAILEARAVRESLRELIDERPDSANVGSASESALRTTKNSPGMFRVGAVIAASVLVSLAVGGLVGFRFGDARKPMASAPIQDVAIAERLPADVPPRESPLRTAAQSALQWLNIGDEKLLALVSLDDGGKSRLVPIVSSEMLADRLLETPMIPISPEQIQRANLNGWNVLKHQQLIAIARPSADPEIVPVEMVRYKFAGRAAL